MPRLTSADPCITPEHLEMHELPAEDLARIIAGQGQADGKAPDTLEAALAALLVAETPAPAAAAASITTALPHGDAMGMASRATYYHNHDDMLHPKEEPFFVTMGKSITNDVSEIVGSKSSFDQRVQATANLVGYGYDKQQEIQNAFTAIKDAKGPWDTTKSVGKFVLSYAPSGLDGLAAAVGKGLKTVWKSLG